jgi:AcrR family transcriptional regulator
VIDSFIDVLLEGGVPTADEVAERADVSMATLFRYFATLDEIRHDAMTRVLDRFPRLFTLPESASATRQQRIRTFVSARLDMHEALHALQLLQRASAVRDPGAAEMVHHSRQMMAEQTSRHFEPELGNLTPARREALVATLNVVTSVESWQTFRISLAQPVVRTRRAWFEAVDGILPLQ